MTVLFQSTRIPPTQVQDDVAKRNNDKDRQLIMPDQIVENYVRGPFTFGQQDLGERLNGDLTASDGSMAMFASAIALKRRFEYMTSSPQSMMVDAELSKWTTRTWTMNIQSGREYLVGLCNWLKLDWLGRPKFRGSRLPGLASENAYLAFYVHKAPAEHISGD